MNINDEIVEDINSNSNSAKTLGEYVDRLRKAADYAERAMIKLVKEYRAGTNGVGLAEALEVARGEKLSDAWTVVFAVEEILAGRVPTK